MRVVSSTVRNTNFNVQIETRPVKSPLENQLLTNAFARPSVGTRVPSGNRGDLQSATSPKEDHMHEEEY